MFTTRSLWVLVYQDISTQEKLVLACFQTDRPTVEDCKSFIFDRRNRDALQFVEMHNLTEASKHDFYTRKALKDHAATLLR